MQIKSLPINKPLSGKINIPGDKSISHRSVIISSISKGKSIITNLLESEDVKKTLKVFFYEILLGNGSCSIDGC